MTKRYAIFDENGFPKGFYSDDVHKEIPDIAIEISDEQWREFIENQGLRKWDGAKPVSYTPPPPTKAELALREIQATENTADLARKIEDITAFIVDGTPLPVNAATNKPYVQEWLEERKGLRAKL